MNVMYVLSMKFKRQQCHNIQIMQENLFNS